ncbi:MAG: PAS domain-containing protein [Halothece sp. Uz-M2-17]|nr:PAS domain-containing protein [Halothece sp. Uz-M2-17]
MDHNIQNDLEKLRQEAQTRLTQRISQAQYDLELYQTELEIQHEELRRSYHELNNLYEEYWFLYYFAPCGYITLNHNRLITRVNHKAAELLTSKDSLLINLGFSRFLAKEDQNLFLQRLEKAEHSGETEHLEVQLTPSEQKPTWVRLDVQPHFTQGGKVSQWQITLVELKST